MANLKFRLSWEIRFTYQLIPNKVITSLVEVSNKDYFYVIYEDAYL
jgi:hypothetical protein